ncbi:MAG: polysaccharide deacetylase family protein [Saprospiraceae bacterium]
MSRHRIVWLLFFILCLLGFSLHGLAFFQSAIFWLNFLAFLAFFIYQSAVLSAEFFFPSICKGNPSNQAVSLTFDDGPIEGYTDKILDILKAHGVKATFFCIGEQIQANEPLAKRIVDEGHIIGNHSYSHTKTFNLLSSSKVLDDILANDQQIKAITGSIPNFFRPPFGVANPMLADALSKSKHLSIGWSLRSFDSLIKQPERLLQRLEKETKAGDIVLLHDYADSMLTILPAYIQFLQHSGLDIQRLDVLIDKAPYR